MLLYVDYILVIEQVIHVTIFRRCADVYLGKARETLKWGYTVNDCDLVDQSQRDYL